MKTVHLPSFIQLISSEDDLKEKSWQDISKILVHPRILHSVLSILLLFFSLGTRQAPPIFFTFVLIRVFVYFRLKEVVNRIEIKNPVCASRVPEGSMTFFRFEIYNGSIYEINNFTVRIRFPGNTFGYDQQAITDPIEPATKRIVGFQFTCDTGMGKFEGGPISIYFSDVFGFYNFEIRFEIPLTVEVTPKVEKIPELHLLPSHQSEMYGNQELFTRGLSVNFSGLRPFVFGDSVRHIAWRRTAKFSSLIVKEFERVVNSDVTIILNLNPENHLGTFEVSTWDLARELCLAVIGQMSEEGNSIAFGYNRGFIERGFGANQMVAILRRLLEFDIFKEANRENLDSEFHDDPLQRWASLVPRGTSLVYIDTLNYRYLSMAQALIKSLLTRNIEVVLFFIKFDDYWKFEDLSTLNIVQRDKRGHDMDNLLSELQTLGAKVYYADLDCEFKTGITERPFLQAVELRDGA